MGGKPVPAETFQDDHVMGLHIDFPLDALRYLVALDVHMQDSEWVALVTGGDGGPHFQG